MLAAPQSTTNDARIAAWSSVSNMQAQTLMISKSSALTE
jgi:hypothetical protein